MVVTVGLLAVGLGLVDLTGVLEAGWLALPRPFAFGIEFAWGPILLMAFIYVISTMETIGDISGTLAAAGREPTTRELKGGLVADGVMSGLAALFSACMVCHGELVRLKPPASRLTSFYLMLALGGALGGIFVNFLAPLVFQGFWELHLAPWDVAAGILILRESGGVITDLDGSEDTVKEGAFVAGNPTIYQALRELLDEVRTP